MPNKSAMTTFQGVVHPWVCDEMGHMNTRHYVGMFDDAMQHFMRHLGHNAIEARKQQLGWADVRHEIDYVAEVPVGALVHIDCQVEKLGNKSIRYRQTMYLSDSGEVAAENVATSVLFDMKARKAVPLPDEFRGEEKNKS
ncbi:thioesterase family protein [Idiomarina sp. PL1-037]|uniref:acyl-CoA thioesterase n=1 Tax=Idiomarina sp. PL1-037 TaxID=3095365 RepID=UPI002ACC0B31|nr:thioesterase family protein [Idiomarina sp. PL1-037]WQC53516.1 thioesterase family protein [Idiomarina sp. PL1-037]